MGQLNTRAEEGMQRAVLIFFATLVFIVCILSSCEKGGGDVDSVQNRESHIAYGQREPGYTSAGTIMSLIDNDSGGFLTAPTCSATLIGKKTVLTARHCVDDKYQKIFGVNPDDPLIDRYIPEQHRYKVVRIDKHRELDIAVLELDREVQGITPAAINDTELSVGDPLKIVGFGLNTKNSKGAWTSNDTRYSTTNVIASLTEDGFTFKGPENLVSADPNATEGGTICPGDSGGPTYITKNGVSSVAGVHSQQSSWICGSTGIDVRVDTHMGWIIKHAEGDVLVGAREASPKPWSWKDCSKDSVCADGQGYCDGDDQCSGELSCEDYICRECHFGRDVWDYCTAKCPCEKGEGDCDDDGQCAQGLICRETDDGTPDVCVPGVKCGDPGHECSESCPCDQGVGDCKGDDGKCREGLVCVVNSGWHYGFPLYVDVCDYPCHLVKSSAEYCSEKCPCAEGQGICHDAIDCGDGLFCDEEAGEDYGKPEFAFCEPARGAGNEDGIDNEPPVAHASAMMTAVYEGNYVILSGASSYDPEGEELTYEWRQTGGSEVVLKDNKAAETTFKAPQVSRNMILTFELIVSDGRADSLPATVAITVRDKPSSSLECTRIPLSEGMGGAGGAIRCH